MNDTLLAAVAVHGLPGGAVLPPNPVDDVAFSDLLGQCEKHRLLGLLGAAVRSGDLDLEPGQRDQLEDRLQGWLAHGLRIEQLLLDAVDALDEAGMEHRVLKGPALARTAYPEPEWRVFGDVDLLVPGGQLSEAARVLQAALGVRRAEPELRPGFDDRFGKEVLLRRRELELDLHRTFVDGPLGLTIHLPDLFTPGQEFILGTRPLVALPPEQQLIHAALSTVAGDWPPRFASMRDVVQLIFVHQPAVEGVLELARRWRAEAVLARALVDAWEALDPDLSSPLLDWARTYRPGALDRLLLRSYVGVDRGYSSHVAAALVIPGISDRAAYLRAIAWPQAAHVKSRGFTSRRRYLASSLKRLGR